MFKELEELKANINDLLEERKDSLKLMKDASETIQLLRNAMPKIVCGLGASLCKLAESVLPADRVVVIKYSRSSQKYNLSVISNDSTSLADIKQDLVCAHKLAERMEDENGVLHSTYSDDSVN